MLGGRSPFGCPVTPLVTAYVDPLVTAQRRGSSMPGSMRRLPGERAAGRVQWPGEQRIPRYGGSGEMSSRAAGPGIDIASLFRRRVRATPGAVAIAGDAPAVTYSQLLARAESVAATLR